VHIFKPTWHPATDFMRRCPNCGYVGESIEFRAPVATTV
jgi:hypothetical protein